MIATVKHLNIYDARTHALDSCSLMISEIAEKYGIDYMSAARDFLTSEIHAMIEDPELEMWEFLERAIFDMWEVERITGDPRNSAHLRSE